MKKQKNRVYFDRKTGRVRLLSSRHGHRSSRSGTPFQGRWEADSGQSFEEFVRQWEQRFTGS